ncbi:MAG: T9SS type A sorting domain-containing protein [Ignavibacteria bacterium]|jgi:hypothetical protein
MKNSQKIFLVFILSIILSNLGYTQFPIYKIFPSNNNQIEPLIVKHPTNPQMLFASSFTINLTTLIKNEGCYLSTNGGLNWFGYDIINDGFAAFHNGDPGPCIGLNGTLIISHFQSFSVQSNRTYASNSTNLGANWSSPITCFATTNEQLKSSIIIDDVSSSSFYGRVYNATTMVTNPYVIIFSYTTNNGQTWVSPVPQINSSLSGRNSNGPNIAIGEQGQVYVAWASSRNTSPYNELAIGFAKSTNSGNNWNVNESIYVCNGIFTSQLAPWDVRVNSYPLIDVDKSGGAKNGWIYSITCEKNLSPAGTDPDVVLHRSTDGGSTWSAGIRVNQDALNNGKIQYFPAIDVDAFGGINIVYYDTRNSPTGDSVQVYLSRSQDGGDTWRDYLIAGEKFYPQPIALGGTGNQGDNIDILSANGKLYPVWMAKYPGQTVYQIWSSIIDLNSIGIRRIESEIPSSFELFQNYPNPFNPATNIKYQITNNGFVTLKVYDMLGHLVTTLVSEEQTSGTYETQFTTNGISSGTYFYKLDYTNKNGIKYTSTKKLVVLK